ncbi:hypothetical protein DFH27DRAFT_545053, partial [Peziza echinospora]
MNPTQDDETVLDKEIQRFADDVGFCYAKDGAPGDELYYEESLSISSYERLLRLPTPPPPAEIEHGSFSETPNDWDWAKGAFDLSLFQEQEEENRPVIQLNPCYHLDEPIFRNRKKTLKNQRDLLILFLTENNLRFMQGRSDRFEWNREEIYAWQHLDQEQLYNAFENLKAPLVCDSREKLLDNKMPEPESPVLPEFWNTLWEDDDFEGNM